MVKELENKNNNLESQKVFCYQVLIFLKLFIKSKLQNLFDEIDKQKAELENKINSEKIQFDHLLKEKENLIEEALTNNVNFSFFHKVKLIF